MNATEREKERIRYELTQVRNDLSGDVDTLGDSFRVKQRLQSSLQSNVGKWVIGGVVAGAVISLAISGKKTKKSENLEEGSERSLVLSLLGIVSKQIIQLSIPVVTGYVSRYLGKDEQAQWADIEQQRNIPNSNSNV